jgi:hypothetical protein
LTFIKNKSQKISAEFYKSQTCDLLGFIWTSASKYKKMNVLDNFEHLLPRKYFHRTFSFFSKKAWKSSKILKIGFFEKSCFF